MKLWMVLLIILVVLLAALAALYFFGKRMQKKQAEQQEQIEAAKQTVSSRGRMSRPFSGQKKPAPCLCLPPQRAGSA